MSESEYDTKILNYAEIWENLTLANDFLFGKIMSDKALCTEMIKRILPHTDIGNIKIIQPQKSEKYSLDTRGVRFDVYAKSDNRKIFDCEVQTSDKRDLPRRTRAYHIAIGLDALDKKSAKKSGSYDDLPDVFVIFICTFDPFGKGRHIYSFYRTCEEDNNLRLNDGAFTIFLNTEGKINDVSPELKAFLDFMKGKTSEDSFIKELEKRLNEAKQNVGWRKNYMLLLTREEEKFAEGIAQGIAQGTAKGRLDEKFDTVRRLRQVGIDDSIIHQATNLSLEEIKNI